MFHLMMVIMWMKHYPFFTQTEVNSNFIIFKTLKCPAVMYYSVQFSLFMQKIVSIFVEGLMEHCINTLMA
jgi:hypothetical protein